MWELMSSLSFCMLTSWNGKILHARPMGAFVRRDENAVYFFTAAHRGKDGGKDADVRRYPQVCLAFADLRRQKYVSLSGTAEIIDDRGKVRELWSTSAKVWWRTPDNPDLRLIKVVPTEAEIWDTPGHAISSLKVALALLKGTTPDHTGEHMTISF